MDLVRIYFIGGTISLFIGLYQFIQKKKQGPAYKFRNLMILFTVVGVAILLSGFLLLLLGRTTGTTAVVIRSIPMAVILIVSACIVAVDNKKK